MNNIFDHVINQMNNHNYVYTIGVLNTYVWSASPPFIKNHKRNYEADELFYQF